MAAVPSHGSGMHDASASNTQLSGNGNGTQYGSGMHIASANNRLLSDNGQGTRYGSKTCTLHQSINKQMNGNGHIPTTSTTDTRSITHVPCNADCSHKLAKPRPLRRITAENRLPVAGEAATLEDRMAAQPCPQPFAPCRSRQTAPVDDANGSGAHSNSHSAAGTPLALPSVLTISDHKNVSTRNAYSGIQCSEVALVR